MRNQIWSLSFLLALAQSVHAQEAPRVGRQIAREWMFLNLRSGDVALATGLWGCRWSALRGRRGLAESGATLAPGAGALQAAEA
jgi:hypothetical protein